MCTAVSFCRKDHYFGRNLDLHYNYQESVVITPRNYPFRFYNADHFHNHYAMIGMATVTENYPLYYEATNEFGLSMAGLNFPGNAAYLPAQENMDNIAPFELIPWVLCQCESVRDAKRLLRSLNLTDVPFNREYKLTPLHWLLSDRNLSVVIEPRADGICVYDDPVGVLTNNPPFDYHLRNLCNYINLTPDAPENRFSSQITIHPYSHGMGAIGLPGDLSSASRFIRAAFTKLNSQCNDTESECVSQFFHILNAVAQTRGCAKIGDRYEITVYSSCCNTDKGIYYYTTYDNAQITAVQLFSAELDTSVLQSYPLIKAQQIHYMN